MKKRDRFFIVMYVSNRPSGHKIGQTSFITEGGYLNKLKTIEMMKKNGYKDECQFVITNIIELSGNDYNDWMQK